VPSNRLRNPTHCGNAPRFHNDQLGRILEEIATKYEEPDPSTDGVTEVMPFSTYPELQPG